MKKINHWADAVFLITACLSFAATSFAKNYNDDNWRKVRGRHYEGGRSFAQRLFY